MESIPYFGKTRATPDALPHRCGATAAASAGGGAGAAILLTAGSSHRLLCVGAGAAFSAVGCLGCAACDVDGKCGEQ